MDHLPDRALIDRFGSQRDEDAFAALVRRHGPMVLHICRRILHDVHAAEDAFQATFLVLSRKATSLCSADTVGCWLHGVAFRLSQNALKQRARRQKHEKQAAVEKHVDDPLAEVSVREAQAILDEELARLPEKYRAPLVLCCLEGRTRDEAARQLGWSSLLVKSRLEEGRKRLHQRLTRRGLTLPAVLVATLLAEEAAPAAVPSVLIRAVVQAARTCNSVSTSIALLAESVLGGTAIGKAKVVIVGLLLLMGALAAGVGAFAPPRPAAKKTESPSVAKAPEPPKSEKPQPARTDRYGDPLPPRALARLGTMRFRPGETIAHIAFSPDGKLLAVATFNGESNANLVSISLWDRATGKRLRQFGTGKRPPLALVFAPNGKTLAAQDERGAIHLWDVETGKELRSLAAGGSVFANGLIQGSGFVFSPDGKAVAARGADKAIHLWEPATSKELRKFPADPEDFAPLAFSRDGKMLATSAKKMIRLWDVETGKEKARLLGHEDLRPLGHEDRAGTPAAFSADGKTLTALARTPGQPVYQVTVCVWDIAAAKLLHKQALPSDAVFASCISPDGKRVLAGGYAGGMDLYDLTTGKEVHGLGIPFHRYRLSTPFARGAIFSAVFSSDGKTIAAGGENRVLQLWDAESRKLLVPFPGHQGWVESLSLSASGKYLASVAWDDRILLWDMTTAQPLTAFPSPKGFFSSVAFSPNGQMLAVVGEAPFVSLLEFPSGKEVRRFPCAKYSRGIVAFSPDGRLLAVGSGNTSEGSGDKSIRLWETATGKLLHRMPVPHTAEGDGGILCLAFSPDGRLLASGSRREVAHVWNVATGQLYCQLPGHQISVKSLGFSPDGQTLATTHGDQKRSIRLWEVRSGKERGRLAGHTDRVGSLAFAPDGRIASAGDDKTIRIWDLNTGAETECFRGHESVVGPLAFSADGQRLVSGGWDTTILVWDVKARPQPRSTPTAELSAKDLEALWTTLAGDDATKAYQAIGVLHAASRQTVPFLKTRLRRAPEIEAKHLARLIADLDDARFAVREKASTELVKYGDRAEPALHKTLEAKVSLEVRRRIETILEERNRPLSGGQLRELRAVEVLEQIGTPPAQEVLQTIAGGAADARETREAKAALQRLINRKLLDR